MQDLTAREAHFDFGENWSDFARCIDERRIDSAVGDLKMLIGPDLTGQSFLDIGCGSGLSSLAALRLGASRVTAVDIDETSVATTRRLLGANATSGVWSAEIRSVFDLAPDRQGLFDVVYSWGVLHHTGDMYRAIDCAARMVRPGGLFVIAIYTRTLTCGFWKLEKRIYSRASRPVQAVIAGAFKALVVAALAASGRNPAKYIREYQRRGMSWSHDIHDWLGGYPYESAASQDIVDRVSRRGFRARQIYPATTRTGLLGAGCTRFVFHRRPGA